MPTLTAKDVTDSLPGEDLDTAELDVALKRVGGWMAEAMGVQEPPAEYGHADWADAVELAILVVTNPKRMAQETRGAVGGMWPMAQQREALLERVRRRAGRANVAPRGAYPEPPAWPESTGAPTPAWGHGYGFVW